jgi:UDP-N-acetylglucosamine 2-epimerase (non-hydrolysing)
MGINQMKICVIFGTRPEVIKLAPVINELEKRQNIELCCINTGQHRELSDSVIALFNIKVKHDLNIMQPNQTLPTLTSRLLIALEKCFLEEQPDLVIVQGDTTTAFTAGLLAYYHNIKIAHVEAGLRTLDKREPFPEEFNRYVLGYLTHWHFSPCEEEAQNLIREQCDPSTIHVVGNTVVDALHYILRHTSSIGSISEETKQLINIAKERRVVLVTTHRRENFGEPFSNICKAVQKLAKDNPDILFVFIAHPNQRWTGSSLEDLKTEKNILFHPPFHYFDFVHVMEASHLILTDSGGIQEEAAVLGVPLLILRNKTERVQGVNAGIAKVIGTDAEAIATYAQVLIDDMGICKKIVAEKAKHFYGKGDAAKQIVDILLSSQKRVHIMA